VGIEVAGNTAGIADTVVEGEGEAEAVDIVEYGDGRKRRN